MNSPAAVHPSDRALSDFSLGKLDEAAADSINRHLGECSDCQRKVAEMSSDSFLGRLRGAQGGSEIPPGGPSNPGSPEPARAEPARRDGRAGTLPPDLVDHPDYQILRELGRGGMGVVYLAHNELMGRDEVLKVVSKHLIERKGVLERFSRETRSAARLMHPNIVQAYSAFRCGESVVFAMEYVEGLDLARLVKTRGPLPVAHASNFTYQVALGLQHAHEQGMVHRDIKPGNLMLARKREKSVVKVLDFGLAKATRESPVDGGLTQAGQMLGTPDFIAPEQIRDAQSAGIQADIYSLGCTLYYLLTGAPPFQGPSLYDLLQAHFSMDAQPLNLIRPEVPAELAALVAKMMAKDIGRRFQTPAEVAESLKPFFKKGVPNSKPEVSRLGLTDVPADGNQDVAATATPKSSEPANLAIPALLATGPQPPLGAEPPAQHRPDQSPPTVPPLGTRGSRPWKRFPLIASAGALGAVLLGVIIIIIINKDGNKVGRVAIETAKGETKVTISPGDPNPVPPPETPAAVTARDDKRETLLSPASAVNPEHHGESIPPGSTLTAASSLSAVSQNAASADPPKEDLRPSPAPRGSFQLHTNSIGMKLVLIPEGDFLMGSPDADVPADADQKPQHAVRITKPFYFGVFEVTQEQYQAIIGDNPSTFSEKGAGSDKVANQATGDFPVEYVSWTDAIMFCNALSKKEGLMPFYEFGVGTVSVPDWSGPGYRLPTEAEWEYACRAGSQSVYSFGNDPMDLNDHGWYKNNSDGRTHPVGQKKPNAFGLFDMQGNVREWCWDWYGTYAKGVALTDPNGPSGTGNKVLRGGSWGLRREFARSATREQRPIGKRHPAIGFRVALNRSDKIRPVPVNASDLLTPRKSELDSGSAASKPAEPTTNAATKTANMPIARAEPPVFVPGSPEAKLAAHGLLRSGAYFVVASEDEVIQRVRKMQPLIGQMVQAFGEYALVLQNEVLLAEAEQTRAALSAHVDALNGRLSQMPGGPKANSFQQQDYQLTRASRDGLAADRDNAARAIDALRRQQAPAGRKEELAKFFATKREEFIKAVGELRPLQEKTSEEYRKLKDDAEVKNAITDYNRSTRAAAHVGPSPTYQKALDLVKNAVRQFSAEAATPKKKGRSPRR